MSEERPDEPQSQQEPERDKPRDDDRQPPPGELASSPEDAREEAVAARAARTAGPAGEEVRQVTPRDRKRMNRRELLKLVPLIAVGAFAIPKLQEPLLMDGLHFSDWASGKLFGRHRLAQTFSNNQVAALRALPLQLLRRCRSRSRSRQMDPDGGGDGATAGRI